MNFFDRVFPFPWLNHEAFNAFPLTAYWIIGLLLIFIGALMYIIVYGGLLKRTLRANTFNKQKRLRPIWDAYQNTFSEFDGKRKSTAPAEKYINETNLFFAFLNYRFVNNVSNIIIGLGILGTFVGLAKGISGIKTTEGTQQLAQSIDSLMAGMSTAFVTSIWGMGLSVVFIAIFKNWQTRISRVIHVVCFQLDKDNLLTDEEHFQYKEEKQKAIISELFDEYLVADTKEGKQMPKNVFRSILEESIQQTEALQSFSDDLGDNLRASMEAMIAQNNTQISSLIEDKLVPVLEDLKQIKQDSGTQVIQNAVDGLAESMRNMMKEFKESVSGDTKQELESLTERLATVSEALTSVPNSMTDITLQVSEVVESLKDTVIENIKKSNEDAIARSHESKQAFDEAKEDYQESIGDIQAHMELMLSSQKDNIKQIDSLTETINETLKRNSKVNHEFDQLVQKATTMSQTLNSMTNTLHGNTKLLNEASGDLNESTTLFRINTRDYLEKNIKLGESQQEILDATVETSELYVEQFSKIESGLKGIFSEVQTGLKDYQAVTAESLNLYLKEFTTTLTSAQKGLESNVSVLVEIADDLTEQAVLINAKK